MKIEEIDDAYKLFYELKGAKEQKEFLAKISGEDLPGVMSIHSYETPGVAPYENRVVEVPPSMYIELLDFSARAVEANIKEIEAKIIAMGYDL